MVSARARKALSPLLALAGWVDARVDGGLGFFLRHWGKTRFMVAMGRRAQALGIERLWRKSPKAFVYFFLFYLVRDTVLYVVIPVWLAFWAGS